MPSFLLVSLFKTSPREVSPQKNTIRATHFKVFEMCVSADKKFIEVSFSEHMESDVLGVPPKGMSLSSKTRLSAAMFVGRVTAARISDRSYESLTLDPKRVGNEMGGHAHIPH